MKMRHTFVFALIVATLACGKIRLGGDDKNRETELALRAALEGPAAAYATKDPEGSKLWKQTRTFYERRKFAPAWVANAKPRPEIDDLIRSLREADREGLDSNLYNVSMLEERRKEASKGFLSDKGFDPREAGALDVWLTYLYMRYASDAADGLSDRAVAARAHADGARVRPASNRTCRLSLDCLQRRLAAASRGTETQTWPEESACRDTGATARRVG